MADTTITSQVEYSENAIAQQSEPIEAKTPKAKDYVKPKVVRVRRVLAAGGHKL